jgi:beta-N-acetylhexosaminidase
VAKAFVCGCAGLALSEDEKDFIAQSDPWGLILFKRNVADAAQVSALTASFRQVAARAAAPVLIDQEGGRVQRMAPPNWQAYPSAASFEASLAEEDVALRAARLTARLIAFDLHEVGVNIDCAPVLDLAREGAHAVIGTRAFSPDPGRVASFGRAVAEGLLAGGVAPVIKHIPGHGRATVDSHFELPVVEASRQELEQTDFAPFAALNDLPIAMTGHVVYRAIDPERPATTSKRILTTIVRGEIGFQGLLLTDDISMKALGGDFQSRAAAAFEAGIDIVLHCNGDLAEARAVASVAPRLEGAALSRAAAALGRIVAPGSFDAPAARKELAAAFARAA